MVTMISEVLEKCSKLKTKAAKIKYLRENNSVPLQAVLSCVFDPNIKFLLPMVDPPYNPSPAVEGQGMFHSEFKKLYLFIQGLSPQNLSQLEREMKFIQMLEAIDPSDAKLLLKVKNKEMPYEGITKELVKEAFPDITY